MNNSDPKPMFSPHKALGVIGGFCLAAMAFLAWVSIMQPLPLEPVDWNYLSSSALNCLVSLAATAAGIQITRQFRRTENPHRIWLFFTIGMGCWAAGATVVFLTGMNLLPYPENTSYLDGLWIMGYVLLGLSLYYQFNLLYSSSGKKRTILYAFILLAGLLVSGALTNLTHHAGLGQDTPWIDDFVAMLYPVFDLTEGIAAIWLALLFGRGRWSRPWWGLILFAIADGVDSFYWLGGYDLIPLAVQNVFNFISATFSFGGYLVIGFTLLMNYYILHYGPDSGMLKLSRISPPPSE
jgi:hypothetical protein